MQLLAAGPRPVTNLLFAPTNDALVATCYLSQPRVWALPAADPVTVPTQYTLCSWFTFSPDGNVVGCVNGGQRVEYDRAANASRVTELTPANEQVSLQAMCGTDGRLILRTSRFGEARIRAFAADGRGGWADLWGVAIEPNLHAALLAGGPHSDRFFSWEDAGGRNRRLVARSALTGAEVASVPMTLRYIEGLAAHPDGNFAVAHHSSSLYVWAPGGKVEKVRTGVLKHYRAIAFHPDGRHLLAGNNDTTARLIDTQTWQVVRQYTWDVGSLAAVAVSPDGALAAAGGDRGQVVVWDLDV
jgi:WD40 repeat protein